MLSRTASDLYWMSRYLERAENLARMLEVSYSLSLMPQGGRGDGLDELAMPLVITGTLDDYLARHGQLHAEQMLQYFALEPSNPASIFNCLDAARTNAHAVRGRITADMWENINATWLEMFNVAGQGIGIYGINHFCDWVKERCLLFRGATYGTIMRGDSYSFISLGTYLERADNTLRLLDARYELMGEDSDQIEGSARSYYQWSALLRALSSFEAFAEVYRGSPKVQRVAELLLLRLEIPRSLRTCVTQLDAILSGLSGDRGRPAQRLAAELEASLRYTLIDEILEQGLHEWLGEYLTRIDALGEAIRNGYLDFF